MEISEVSISSGTPSGTNTSYELLSQYGAVNVLYDPVGRSLYINSIAVNPEHRKQGEAQRLLRASERLARSLGATTLWSIVTSRSSLQAMLHVFGSESLNIYELGNFSAPGEPDRFDTEAYLHLELRN